ncbi:hypothetical protein N8766_00465 [bacterium]|jgi:hypothetical protein|nr:hypothetical protein [bacterium]
MPSPLPDGKGIVFLVQSEGDAVDKVVLYSEGARRTVFELPGESLEYAVVYRSGYLVYDRATSSPGIWAVALSLDEGRASQARPFKVAEGTDPSVSRDGALVFLDGTSVHEGKRFRLVWFDRAGTVLPIEGMRAKEMGYNVSLSKNEDQALVAVRDEKTETTSIWRQRIDRPGVENQVTFPPSGESDFDPVWHPDGEHFFFRRSSLGLRKGRSLPLPILKARIDGQDKPVELAKGVSFSISEDGRFLTYEAPLPEEPNQRGIAFLDFKQKDLQPQFLPGANEGRQRPLLSPDGRFVAFMRRRQNTPQYFLTRFPSGEGEWLISGRLTTRAFWGADPQQTAFYFYRMTGSDVREMKMTLPMDGREPDFEKTTVLYDVNEKYFQHYVVPGPSRDGQRFLVPQETDFEAQSQRKLILKLNWVEEFGG